MTVFPDRRDLSTDHVQPPQILLAKGRGGGSYYPREGCCHGIDSGLTMVDPSMAEKESRAGGCNKTSEEAPPSTSASGSKGLHGTDEDEDEDAWLQLSIGGGCTDRDLKGRNKGGDGQDRSVLAARCLVELNLLPTGRGSSSSVEKLEATSSPLVTPAMGLAMASPLPPLLFQLQQESVRIASEFPHPHTEGINWGFRPVMRGQAVIGGAVAGTSSILSYPSSSSSSSIPYASPYFRRPSQLHTVGAPECAAGPSRDMIKIMDPSQRRHSGIWFMLHASQNQDRESYLPQIPKSYLRTNDGRMTVRLLTKYLVNKLKLDSESEVEITCRGLELQHDFTLQHVRDNIWSPRKDYSSSSSSSAAITTTSASASASTPFTTLLPGSSTIPHLMVLHYSRRRRITTTPAPTISLT
ncbi:hypothetical protein MLD38_004289 [Melastoma candidum]|uniref:Uncharacterized protein n=1 Tax=Melastoma candidum TaxID=119954 RepID=A0ACB9S558_9MYRT|nr:hypothetical protein MLD38_004289 [Melastoma candidum]